LEIARGHLCDLGHRHITALVSPQLLGAALRCLQQADPSDRVVVAIHEDEPGEVRPALTRLLSTTPSPTAIICGSERIALGALRVARDLGLDVPAALSIVALGESWVAQASTPSLTAVSLPLAALGEQAARMLLKQMAGESPVPALGTVPVATLTTRGSSARYGTAGN
jgi:LacI family transcriptional regulator